MNVWTVTYCGPDRAKCNSWKVVAMAGTRAEHNLRSLVIDGLTEDEAKDYTPAMLAWRWRVGQ